MAISLNSDNSRKSNSPPAGSGVDSLEPSYNSWESLIGLWERANVIRSFVWSQESMDETALFTQFLVRVRRFFSVDFCFVALLQEGGKIIQVGVPEASLHDLPANFVRRSLDLVATSRIPVTWTQLHAKNGFRTVVVSPLSPSVGEPLGFLMLGHSRARHFTKAELLLLQSLAGEVSWAVREQRSKHRYHKLISAVSVELKHSLNLVLEDCSLFREAEPSVVNSHHEEKLSSIEKNTQETLRTISSFLDSTIAHEGHFTLLRENIDLVELVDDALLSCRDKAREAGVALETHYAGNLPRAYSTDPARFRHMLRNLGNHAIEVSERGPVLIRVRKNSEFIEFNVRATGPRAIGFNGELGAEINPCGQQDGEVLHDRLESLREDLKLLNGHLHLVTRAQEGLEISMCLP